MEQGNFLFGRSEHRRNSGSYFMRLSVVKNRVHNQNTLEVSLSVDAKEKFGIKTGERFEIGFDQIGMIAIMRVEAGGFMASGQKRSVIKSYTKNFRNLPEYMVDGYAKIFGSTEAVYIAKDDMIVLNTELKG